MSDYIITGSLPSQVKLRDIVIVGIKLENSTNQAPEPKLKSSEKDKTRSKK